MRNLPTVVLSCLFVLSASAAGAEPVFCGAGNVPCLVAAIHQANAHPTLTTIWLAPGTYVLDVIDNDTDGPNALPSIVTPIRIQSDDAMLARDSGAAPFRLFHVGVGGNLRLTGITLIDGEALVDGGGIFNRGTLTLIDCLLDGNSAPQAGGAIYNEGGTVTLRQTTVARSDSRFGAAVTSSGGSVTVQDSVLEENHGFSGGSALLTNGSLQITRSLVRNNSAPFSAAMLINAGGSVAMTRTTVIGNVSQSSGGLVVEQDASATIRDSAFISNRGDAAPALRNSGTMAIVNTTFGLNRLRVNCDGTAISNRGTLSILNSTFAENIVGEPNCGFVRHSVINATNAVSTTIQNSIISNVVTENPAQEDCLGNVTSLGNNLIQNPSGCGVHPSDQFTVDVLGPLFDTGLPGFAHFPLLAGSLAIDSATKGACPLRDQIGQLRRPRCDIGAVEFSGVLSE
jgi:hypothetical protein